MRLPTGFVAPRYGGGSIADVAPSVLRALAGGPGGLRADVLPAAALRDVRRIVLLVLDGLGASQLDRLAESGAAPALAGLERATITTVAPSTTSTALATLATGLSPVEHGILGYRMFLPDLGLTANMIKMRAVHGGDLERAGLSLETFFPYPTIFERLADAGIRSEAVTRGAFLSSGLTRMIYRGSVPWGFLHAADLFVRGRRLLDSMREERGFVRLYYDGIDTVAHEHGPLSQEHEAEAAAIDAAFHREFLRHVDDPEALLLVTADHGHVTVPPERVVRFHDHPGFLDHLVVAPTGEGRFSYLHCRPGHVDRARKYVESEWAESAWILETAEAEDAGLFGTGRPHPQFARRAGDLLLLARDDWRFASDVPTRPGHVGNHGGLGPDEMLVPLLWKRFG